MNVGVAERFHTRVVMKERVIMLRFAILSLVCSVTAGVFGFGGGASSSWVWGPILILVFLAFSAVGFLAGLTAQPTRLREARINNRSSDERPENDIHST